MYRINVVKYLWLHHSFSTVVFRENETVISLDSCRVLAFICPITLGPGPTPIAACETRFLETRNSDNKRSRDQQRRLMTSSADVDWRNTTAKSKPLRLRKWCCMRRPTLAISCVLSKTAAATTQTLSVVTAKRFCGACHGKQGMDIHVRRQADSVTRSTGRSISIIVYDLLRMMLKLRKVLM